MSILDEAKALCYGDRNAEYGHPAQDYAKVAAFWTVILGTPVSPQQAILCMIAMKMARAMYRPKRDTVVDIAGYADCLQRTVEYEAEQAAEAGGHP